MPVLLYQQQQCYSFCFCGGVVIDYFIRMQTEKVEKENNNNKQKIKGSKKKERKENSYINLNDTKDKEIINFDNQKQAFLQK